jgi:hypothetical protein
MAEQTDHTQAPTAVRPGCLIGLGAILLGFFLVAGVSVAMMLRGAGRVDLGKPTDYPLGTVVYRSTDGLLVTRQLDGSVVVFSDVDPHNAQGRDDCRVTFRTDLAVGDEPGRFFDICTGSTYDLSGRGLSGDGLNLRQVSVEPQENGTLKAERD